MCVVIWDLRGGVTQGYYRGYLAFTDPAKNRRLAESAEEWDLFRMRGDEILRGLETEIYFFGFDTSRAWDNNVGPQGEKGFGSDKDPRYVHEWTKDKVFDRLNEIADNTK